MASQAALGQKALEAHQYNDAIAHFTKALAESRSPIWLINRSTAYTRVGSCDLALHDADEALLVAKARARRELMVSSQLRRGIALYSLQRYGDALACFGWVKKLSDKEKGLDIWQAKTKTELKKLTIDDERRNVTVKEMPDAVLTSEADAGAHSMPKTTPAAELPNKRSPTSFASVTPKEKIKHDWYQSATKVTVTILAKGVPSETAEVEIEADSLSVSFPVGSSGSTYNLSLGPLFGPVDAKQSGFVVSANKIEISLHKATPGVKWATLEGEDSLRISKLDADDAGGTDKTSQLKLSANLSANTYPTSSRKGPKNWDALADDALKKDAARSGDGNGKDPSWDDDDEGGDAASAFFKKLYKSADADTQRAMMKSYVESNGTSLSTNWSEVGSKTFDTQPPDGLEAKKWES